MEEAEHRDLGEYRALLKKRQSTSFYQRTRRCWSQLFIGEKIALSALGALMIISIVFLFTTRDKVTSKNNSGLPRAVENLSPSEAEKRQFLEEWERANKTLQKNQGIQRALYQKLALQIDDSMDWSWNIGIRNSTFEEELLIICALIAENVKKSLKKCVSSEWLPTICTHAQEPVPCDPKPRYRRVDGSCNNLQHSNWGMAGASYLRWLTPDFADDVSIPRRSVRGVPLPNARQLSNELFSRRTVPNSNLTMLFVFFGLFLDHDLIFTKQPPESFTICCSTEMKENAQLRHPGCFEIDIHQSDPLYGPLNATCMGLLRDTPAIGKCPGRRENANTMSSYIDCSDVYGRTNEEADSLRTFKKGHLRTYRLGSSILLPKKANSGNACRSKRRLYDCFVSGDTRVNMVLQLTILHTVWFREHNRLALELHHLNPGWDDERLYQEARRIVTAEMQYVTYREFLPVIFGQNRTKKYGLLPEANEEYDGYDVNMDATIHNAFSAAAFRFGHTLVQNYSELRDEEYRLTKKCAFHEMYKNPSALYKHRFDDIVRGMVAQKSKYVERFTTEEIRGRLFQPPEREYGLDLTAYSIQRGRDHGLPSYLKWREFCRLPVANSWEDLYAFMKKKYVDTLRKSYLYIEDVDLISGALGEHSAEGSLVGSTYLCLLRRQFLALRRGDRFWFQNPNQPGSFTKEQLQEIYKSSFARILCDASDAVKTIQRFPFSVTSDNNPVLRCEDIPTMDLTEWKEI